MSYLRKLVLLMTVALVLPSFATEVAVLRNGFSIRHERREVIGTVTRLYVSTDNTSYVDVPTAEIEHFEEAPMGAIAPALRPASSSRPSDAAKNRPSQADLDQAVNLASGRYRLDPDLVNSVIKAESGFNAHAVSRKGAQGLMQLMPDTASQLGVPDAFDPQANVEGGTRYLRELLERYNFDLVKALAAYNAGSGRVDQYKGVPPYYETRAYVARIVRDFNKKKIAEKKATVSKTSTQKTAPNKKTSPKKAASTGKSQVAENTNSQ